MLLRFAANDVNHCVWCDSRVILSNQKSVFTQLAKKKKIRKNLVKLISVSTQV